MDLNSIPRIKNVDSDHFFLIAGPCIIEDESTALAIGERIVKISDQLKIPYIFKGSFKKANRSRMDSFTGIGDDKALKILQKVSNVLDVPVLTDVHEVSDVAIAYDYVDVLQIPDFLVRQTDLILAAARTGKVVNLKKGQFMSPLSMQHAVEKVKAVNSQKVWITERGTMFGYRDLIVDFRGIPQMRRFAPVVLDVTHSLQQPNQETGVTGGRPEMIETIARAGIASGVDGLFIETHFDPKSAKSDGANMLDLSRLESLFTDLISIRKTINKLKN